MVNIRRTPKDVEKSTDNNQIKESSSIKSGDTNDLKEILEIEKLSKLLEKFYNATGLANSIVDLNGNILLGVGWKSICTEFHRKHKVSLERCLKSDTILANQLKKKEKYSICICQNGMVDVATPITIDGVHVANLFIGQFFFETPDKDFFIKQAEELGFDKEKYIKALEECHVYNKETILRYLDFFDGLINIISEANLKTIKNKDQNEEKDKRAAELIIANKELAFQNEEKDKRAAELVIADKELAFQTKEKADRAAELIIANRELAFQNEEKDKRAAELVIADKELAFQTEEKADRAAELIIANKELRFQNEEKGKRAEELLIANKELTFQSEEIEQKVEELLLAKEQIEIARVEINQSWRYNRSLIEASTDPIMTIDQDGIIINVNSAVESLTGLPNEKLIGTSFPEMFSEPEKARGYYQTVFEKGKAFNYELNFKHINGFTTPVIYNAFVYSDNEKRRVGLLVASDDITTIQKDEIVYLQINLHLLMEQRTRELMEANKKLAIENEKNEYLGYHDYLTGLYNRRFFQEELKRLDTKANLPISIIMCDVNGLKLINDSFGHGYGDELLIKTAETLKRACRAGDVISRLGGDEFVIILPKTDAEGTVQIANRIKEFAAQDKFEKVELSISYGYDTKKTDEQSIIEVFSAAENHMYRHKLYERSSRKSNTIDIIMNTLFEKSGRESQHSGRVSSICLAIASKMKFDKGNVDKMRIAGLIHDIGKIGIDDKVLNKAGSLSSEERHEIERHPEIGWRILSTSIEFLELAQFVLNHHERWDGDGYPNGHKGEKIPLEARIIAVADAYDAMTSERTYRRGMDKKEAIEEMKRCSGTQFDPEIVDVFLNKVLPYNSNFEVEDKTLLSAVVLMSRKDK